MTAPCRLCRSLAINPGMHGRPPFAAKVDHDLCDACFWRTRVEKLEELLKVSDNAHGEAGRELGQAVAKLAKLAEAVQVTVERLEILADSGKESQWPAVLHELIVSRTKLAQTVTGMAKKR